MTSPIQLGHSYKEWWFIALAGAAACLLTGGAMLHAVRHPAGLALLVAAGVAAFSTAMSAFVIARSRFQVEITADGFLVRDRRGERAFHDDQVICASLSSAANYVNGVLKSTTRTFDVWVEGAAGAEQVKMTSRLAVGARDPLAPLIERVMAHLYERANAALEAGQPFEGEGWTLHDDELVVSTRRNPQSVRFESLAAADIFDNHLCVWKHGQDEPVLRIPISSANTQILRRLLHERITPHPENIDTLSAGRLGRVLFERRPGKTAFMLVWLLPVVVAINLAVAALVGLFRGNFDALLIGLVLSGCIGLFWVFFMSQCIVFRVHEHGVRRQWLFRTQQLKYSEVDAFTYSAVKQYAKGVYTGTNFTLTFTSLAGRQLKKLVYTKNLRNADADLDHLRDHVSQLIANRMTAQFAQGRAVVWTDGLRFLPEGLEYRASGFFGRKPPVVFPYSQIFGYDASQGFFWLWLHGKKKPVVKESMGLPNFFPGYLLLVRMLAARPATAPIVEQASAR